jgi:hypothetical protein
VGTDAVVYHGLEKWVAGRRPKCIVANLPVHSILLREERANSQLFEGEYATKSEQIVKRARKEHVGVEIEPAETINGQIPEKIVTLNPCGE